MSSPFLRKITDTVRRRLFRMISPNPIHDYFEYSVIHPVQSGPGGPNDFLINLALDAAREAQSIRLPGLTARVRRPTRDFTPTWPGEHYRLLAALVKLMRPSVVVEIGTFQGLSALALKAFLPPEGRIVTFDIIDWHDAPTTCLAEDDFTDGRLRQELGDLADPIVFDRHRQLIEQTDLLFVDAPKDGIFERRFLHNLETVEFREAPVVVFDDIRVWNMLDIWHEIERPKLDMTSFGHWSGTGVVEWKAQPKST